MGGFQNCSVCTSNFSDCNMVTIFGHSRFWSVRKSSPCCDLTTLRCIPSKPGKPSSDGTLGSHHVTVVGVVGAVLQTRQMEEWCPESESPEIRSRGTISPFGGTISPSDNFQVRDCRRGCRDCASNTSNGRTHGIRISRVWSF